MLLKTDLLPYDEVVDMFILDPDGFIIRLVVHNEPSIQM